MTTESVILTLLRRWYLALFGVLLTVLVMVAAHRVQPMYYGELNVRFLAPISTKNPNVIRTSSLALVDMAGLVKDKVNEGEFPAGGALSLTVRNSPETSSVRLPNSGNQFVAVFDKALLSVEVTGTDKQSVARQVDRLATEIERTTLRIQVNDGVAPVNRITTKRDPGTAQLTRLAGHEKRAQVVLLVLGLGTTCWIVVELDRLLVRRVRRRAPQPVAAVTGSGASVA